MNIKEFKNILPGKKVKILIYLILILILIYLIAINFKKTDEFENFNKANEQNKKINSLLKLNNEDRDGDGLEDWQEHLYGTDIELVDTDKDGVSDFDEIKKGEDPLSFGSGNDETIKVVDETKSGVAGILDQKKEMEEYKKKLQEKERLEFEKYLKKEGEKISEEERLELFKKRKSNSEIKSDFNLMGKIIGRSTKNFDILKSNHFNVFFSDIASGEKKLTSKGLIYVKNLATMDKNVADSLKNIVIKNNDVDGYKKRMYSHYETAGNILDILVDRYEKDEKIELKTISHYNNSISNLTEVRQQIHLFIEAKGIKFSGSEPGSIFKYSL